MRQHFQCCFPRRNQTLDQANASHSALSTLPAPPPTLRPAPASPGRARRQRGASSSAITQGKDSGGRQSRGKRVQEGPDPLGKGPQVPDVMGAGSGAGQGGAAGAGSSPAGLTPLCKEVKN